MSCSNCFNGCADIVSDQCVKYTGVNIPGLGIATGDPLLVVENQIINKILELITGEGIIPIIDPADLCSLVTDYLPDSGDITLNHVISALFQSVCNLDGKLFIAEGTLTALNADYVIGCLSGVSVTTDTHGILQATINKLCEVNEDVITLTAELETNYVLISDIDSYISSYITSLPGTSLYSNKMIPYSAVPFFAPPAFLTGKFDITGAGVGDWVKIYLCNGQNGTPDLRGRVLVGATSMGSTAYNSAVDPGLPGNPTYNQGSLFGANQIALTSPNQLPVHTHSTTVIITDPGHKHGSLDYGFQANAADCGGDCDSIPENTGPTYVDTTSSTTGLKGNGNDPINPNVTVTVGSTGSAAPHANVQPGYGTNYIIFIP